MINNKMYKKFLFEFFLKSASKDINVYINKDTRDYSNYDDWKQIRAVSPIYIKDGNSMGFEIHKSWLRIEVTAKIKNIGSYVLYSNWFGLRNDEHKYIILDVYNASIENSLLEKLKNTPYGKNELRKLKIKSINKT